MKSYEIMTIAKVGLGEEGATGFSNTVKDLITSNKGKILDSNSWGKRKFAYEIGHETEGFYEVIKFEMPSDNMSKFKTKLNLVAGLVRYLVTAE